MPPPWLGWSLVCHGMNIRSRYQGMGCGVRALHTDHKDTLFFEPPEAQRILNCFMVWALCLPLLHTECLLWPTIRSKSVGGLNIASRVPSEKLKALRSRSRQEKLRLPATSLDPGGSPGGRFFGRAKGPKGNQPWGPKLCAPCINTCVNFQALG